MILSAKVRNSSADYRECGERERKCIRQFLGRETLPWSFWRGWCLFEHGGDLVLDAYDRLRELLFGGLWRNDCVADGRSD